MDCLNLVLQIFMRKVLLFFFFFLLSYPVNVMMNSLSSHFFAVLAESRLKYCQGFSSLITWVLEFFSQCNHYHGPHTWECLASIWKQAGCVKEGELYPGKMRDLAVKSIMELNLE